MKENKAALQHVGEREDLQKKEQEVLSSLSIIIAQLQHIQATSSLKTLLYSIFGTDGHESDAFSPLLPAHQLTFNQVCPLLYNHHDYV